MLHLPFIRSLIILGKVRCTLVQALRLCTGNTALRGSRDITLLFLDHGARRRWGVSVTPRALFTPGKDSVPIVQEAGWAPGQVRKFSPSYRDSIPGSYSVTNIKNKSELLFHFLQVLSLDLGLQTGYPDASHGISVLLLRHCYLSNGESIPRLLCRA